MPLPKVKKWSVIVIFVILSAFILSIGIYFVYPDVAKLRKVNPKKTAFMEYREARWRDEGKNKKIQQKPKKKKGKYCFQYKRSFQHRSLL